MTPSALADELGGKTALIVGYGSIGRATEERLKPFDVNILRLGRRRREGVEPEDRLDDLLPQADIVILLLPLTPQTRGLINRKRLAAIAMQRRIGETFDAIVTGVTPKGTFILVQKPHVEGLLAQGQKGLDVGDKLRAKLIRTDVQHGFIDFARA